MYIWNIFKTLIYLLFCSKKFTYSEPNDNLINKLKPISLNLKDKITNQRYNYFKKYNSQIYTANNGFGFSSVNTLNSCSRSKKIIWDAKNNANYAQKVILIEYNYSNMNEVKIFKPNGEQLLFVNNGKKWEKINLSVYHPEIINIDKIHDTYMYSTSNYKNFKNYEAKVPFVFNTITKSNGPCKTTTLWKAKNKEEFANKVTINGRTFKEKTGQFTIYCINGDIKHMGLINGKWEEINPWTVLNILKKEHTYEYEYFKYNKNIESFTPNGKFLFKRIESIECTKFNKTIIDIWVPQNTNKYVKKVFIVKLNDYYTCLVLILVNNEFLLFYKSHKLKIWIDHTENIQILDRIKSMGLDLRKLYPKKEIKIKHREKKVYWKQTYENWLKSLPFLHVEHETPVEQTIPDDKPVKKSINLIVLDLSKMYDLVGYEIKYKPDKTIYIADDSYLFIKVQNGDELVWKSSDGSYPYRVIYKVVENKPKLKVYFNDHK